MNILRLNETHLLKNKKRDKKNGKKVQKSEKTLMQKRLRRDIR